MVDRFEVIYRQDSAMYKGTKAILVDRETGVNYLFMQSGSAGGLTPLIDGNGKPIITKKN